MSTLNLEVIPGQWNLSEIINESHVRIKHECSRHAIKTFTGTLAQCQVIEGELLIYSPQEIMASNDLIVYNVQSPNCFAERRLGFKPNVIKPPANWKWNLNIMPLPNTLFIQQNITVEAKTSIAPSTKIEANPIAVNSVTSSLLIAANTLSGIGSRQGLTIINNSRHGYLLLGVDNRLSSALRNYLEILPPTATYEFPVNYIGALYGIYHPDTPVSDIVTVIEFLQ